MDEGQQVQDENLVNDQVTQAIADGGATDGAATPAEPAAAVPTVPTEPVAPAAAPEPAADTGVAEANVINTAPVTAPMIDTPDEEDDSEEAPEETPAETPAVIGPVGADDASDDELMTVKQAALEQLSPLVDHLDLPPDQKFDTYMEILRASDDKSLVQPAFEEAQKIDDEDKKAQALLDVVNEVNYLTQDHEAAE